LSNSSRASSGRFPADRPVFYYITDRKQLAGRPLIYKIKRAISCGVDFIQIREKDLPDKALFELTCRAVALARKSKSKIIVNGRADIALAAGAHGVHLPVSGVKISDLRSWLPGLFLIGASTHSVREALHAISAGADYVLLGPVYRMESKAAFGLPLGLDGLRRACLSLCAPVLGLGGIRAESVGSVLEAGTAGIAAISLFQNDAEFAALRKKFLKDAEKRLRTPDYFPRASA
jgi:thiamine-phosphate pyrophosphorylase